MQITKSVLVEELAPCAGNPRNSEGSFLRLDDGRIAFAYSRYIGKHWDDHEDCCIAVVYSHDNGETFDTEHFEVLVNATDYGETNVMSVTLARMHNGDIGLFYLLKQDGGMRTEYRLRRYHGDFSQLLSDVCCLPEHLPGYYVVNNDRVIALADGTWMFPASLHPSTVFPREGAAQWLQLQGTVVFYVSRDDGRTWHQTHAFVHHPNDNCDTGLQEPGVIELRDGLLYGYFRTSSHHQYESVSIDGGESWFMPRPSQFSSPDSPMLMKKNPNTGKFYAIWNPYPKVSFRQFSDYTWGRTPLVLAESEDGVHFSPSIVIEDDPERGFCYPAMYFLDEHTMLLSYCSGKPGDGCILSRTSIRKIVFD